MTMHHILYAMQVQVTIVPAQPVSEQPASIQHPEKETENKALQLLVNMVQLKK